MRPKTLLSWSSGKDSAWALAELRRRGEVEVVGLLTTVTAAYDRVSMHGVRRGLLEKQAQAARLPLVTVEIPAPCPNTVYEEQLGRALAAARQSGVTHVAFGDLFLEDLRAWREARLREAGMTGVFPIWRRDTAALAREMIGGGLRARLTCVDPRKLPRELAGREFDAALLSELPADVDPCGENGEFHTFATHGPMFHEPIAITRGEVVEREGFVFADFVATERSGPSQVP